MIASTFEIFNPLPEVGGGKVNGKVKDAIQKLIRAVFENEKLELKTSSSKHKKQQYDGTSCGVISAENGKDIIEGASPQKRIKTEYKSKKDSYKLREQHLQEVGSDRFLEIQAKNENWRNSSFIPPKDWDITAKALLIGMKECDIDLASLCKDLREAVEIAKSIRHVIKKHRKIFNNIEIQEGLTVNLIDKLFNEESGELKFKDKTVDTLALIIRNINKSLFDERKKVRKNYKSLKESEKYKYYYDDSSSEDETEEHLECEARSKFEDVIDELKNKLEQKKISPKYCALASLAHEYGIRILKSREVSNYYYPLKFELKGPDNVLKDKHIESCIEEAFESALKKIYERNKNDNKYENQRKNMDSEFVDIVNEAKKHKRRFVRTVNEKVIDGKDIDMQKIILNYETFLEKLPKTKRQSFIKEFKAKLFELLRGQNYEQKVVRVTLPDIYQVKFDVDQDYTPAKFLAYIRLVTTSNKRLIRNSLDEPKVAFGQESVFLIRRFTFPKTDTIITELQAVNKKTGTMGKDKVLNLGSYESIGSKMEGVGNYLAKSKISNFEIVEWVRGILQGKGLKSTKTFLKLKIPEQERRAIEEIIASLTYLLFGLEVARNPASLLINCMILELVQADKLSWKEAFNDQMPMAMDGAVPAARGMNKNCDTTSKHLYDKAVNSVASLGSAKFLKLLELESKIFGKWLLLEEKKEEGSLKKNFDQLDILEKYRKEDKVQEKLSELEKKSLTELPKLKKIRELIEKLSPDSIKDTDILKIWEKLARLSKKWYCIDILYFQNIWSIYQNSRKENAANNKSSNNKSNPLENNFDDEEGYFCNSITYFNPLLNDPELPNLLFLARLHFGMAGVDALIDLGTDPEKYEAFSNHRQELGDEQSIILFVTQELENLEGLGELEEQEEAQEDSEILSSFHLIHNSTPALTILDPQGRALAIDNDYLQKLHSQLLYYHETDELLETARFALAAGYNYEIETEPSFSALDDLQDALGDEASTDTLDFLESLLSASHSLGSISPILDEKLEAQQEYYLQTGIAYETLADYLQLDPLTGNDNEEEDRIDEYNNTNHTNTDASSLPSLSEEDLLKLQKHSLFFPSLFSDQ